jgi:hypothetical protein
MLSTQKKNVIGAVLITIAAVACYISGFVFFVTE